MRLEEANTRLRREIDRLRGLSSPSSTPSSPPSVGSGHSAHRGEGHTTGSTRPIDEWRIGTGEEADNVSFGSGALPDVVSAVSKHNTAQRDWKSRLIGFAAHLIAAVRALPHSRDTSSASCAPSRRAGIPFPRAKDLLQHPRGAVSPFARRGGGIPHSQHIQHEVTLWLVPARTVPNTDEGSRRLLDRQK